jgi:hypothetical protein
MVISGVLIAIFAVVWALVAFLAIFGGKKH